MKQIKLLFISAMALYSDVSGALNDNQPSGAFSNSEDPLNPPSNAIDGDHNSFFQTQDPTVGNYLKLT